MKVLLEILIYGAVQSASYAMVALGFSLILGVARVVNLAHTGFYMIGAYLIYTFVDLLGLGLYVSLLVSVVAAGLISIIVMQLCIRPLMKIEHSVMMITCAIVLLIQELIFVIYGPVDRNIKGFAERKLSIFGVVDIDSQRMLTLAVAVVLVVFLWLFINKTKAGKAIVAVAQDQEGAILMGINPNGIFMQVIFISAALASVAGAFLTPTLGARPHMWEPSLAKCFAIVILGGMGSLEGTILAAILVGYSEVIISFTISSYLSELVALILILGVLMIRPSGLMGKRTEI